MNKKSMKTQLKKNPSDPAARASGGEPAKIGSQEGLVLATPGESFFGVVQRPLGDKRFVVENVTTGCMVDCRMKGSLRQWVKAEDWVLVGMRTYESDTQHYERRGEILLKYKDGQVKQLSKAGFLPHRAQGSDVPSHLEFVDFIGQDEFNRDSAASDAETDYSDEDESDQEVAPAFATSTTLCAREEYFPSPSSAKKSRKSSGKSSDSLILDVDFHHHLDFLPAVSVPTSGSTPAPSAPPPRRFAAAPAAQELVSIQARVKFWNEADCIGYATPLDKTQTKVRLHLSFFLSVFLGLRVYAHPTIMNRAVLM
jgi:translation initiation factor IF-1